MARASWFGLYVGIHVKIIDVNKATAIVTCCIMRYIGTYVHMFT